MHLTTKITIFSLLFSICIFSSKANEDIYGIDISHYQGSIDWKRVKHWEGNKIHFVYIKATEGATLQDNCYKKNTLGAKESNLLVGSYHYFRASTCPINQFRNFSSVVEKKGQDLIPIVDVEELSGCNEAQFHKNFKHFLKLMQGHFEMKPLIYTSNSFYNKYLANKYNDYHFFIGRYSPQKPILRDKKDWAIWQFTQEANVAGINHRVDVNRISDKYTLDHFLIKKNKALTL